MCGRFTQHHTEDEIIERFAISDVRFHPAPRYNIAPTQLITAITPSRDGRQLTSLRWGLIPRWAKDTKLASNMINARAETIADKPAYRTPLAKQRCLIPADGWFEWKTTAHGKQPHYFRRRDGGLFALAGLWDEWQDKTDPGSEPLRTCAIITCEANELSAPIHQRMPVILRPEVEAIWLDPKPGNPLQLADLLAPYPDSELEVFPVSRAVNSPSFDQPDLIAEV
ncbi:MAG TPA: SOS response-associated peptidase [Blastocatellia bacterium]|nr:SOS response-associated peptidase [Blastocatellia bacterium]